MATRTLLQRIRLKVLKLILTKKEFDLLPFSWLGYLINVGWFESISRGQSIDKNQKPIPWITYPAFYFLRERLTEGINLFEYGSGNSILYYLENKINVFSVEHDYEWFQLIKSKLHSGQLYYRSIFSENEIKAYVEAIREPQIKFDVIVIDGRYRRRCMLAATNYLKDTGVIILDNSERNYYSRGIEYLMREGFKKIDFWGLAPIAYKISCTSIFYKEENLLNI